jgi:RHH-type rel operon transcriptional repressor/antitoxin RelB
LIEPIWIRITLCTTEHKENIMQTTTLTLRVPVEVKDQLEKLADATHRSKSYLAGEALRQYLVLEAWQIGEIQRALQEADAGDFATDEEFDAVVRKYAG